MERQAGMKQRPRFRASQKFVLLAVLSIVTLIVADGPTVAEEVVLEVTLPELIGFYTDGMPILSSEFTLTISYAAIQSASVRIRGDLPWPSYTTSCGYNGIIFTLQVPAAVGTWETTFYVDQRVGFEVISELIPVGEANWDYLADGHGIVTCAGVARPLPPGCSYIHGGCCPIGELTYASILFVYDSTVPAEATTWGRIKVLYE